MGAPLARIPALATDPNNGTLAYNRSNIVICYSAIYGLRIKSAMSVLDIHLAQVNTWFVIDSSINNSLKNG